MSEPQGTTFDMQQFWWLFLFKVNLCHWLENECHCHV
jgi:hypothetical protein